MADAPPDAGPPAPRPDGQESPAEQPPTAEGGGGEGAAAASAEVARLQQRVEELQAQVLKDQRIAMAGGLACACDDCEEDDADPWAPRPARQPQAVGAFGIQQPKHSVGQAGFSNEVVQRLELVTPSTHPAWPSPPPSRPRWWPD